MRRSQFHHDEPILPFRKVPLSAVWKLILKSSRRAFPVEVAGLLEWKLSPTVIGQAVWPSLQSIFDRNRHTSESDVEEFCLNTLTPRAKEKLACLLRHLSCGIDGRSDDFGRNNQ